MVRIDSLTLREIRLPLRDAFTISSGTTDVRRILLVEIEGTDGVRVWSECVAGERPHYSYETVDTAWLAIREWIAPLVLGRDFEGPEALHMELERGFRGHRMAKAAIEMGSWALVAEGQHRSLARTIGGAREQIEVGISLGIQPDSESLIQKAADALSAGYRKIKIKVRPGADVRYVAAVREALGPKAPLMADANCAYSLDDLEMLIGLDGLNLIMIEQPLGPDDLVQHAELQLGLVTPICLDESITSLDRARDMVTLDAGRIINIKPGRVGGFTAARSIHDFCADQEIPVWCGGMLESGVGRAYNVALASLPNFTIPGDLSPSARYWERDIVTPEWTMDSEGRVAVPFDRPGIGVDVDVDHVEKLTVKREVLSAP